MANDTRTTLRLPDELKQLLQKETKKATQKRTQLNPANTLEILLKVICLPPSTPCLKAGDCGRFFVQS